MSSSMHTLWRYILGFLIGAIPVMFAAWALGLLPGHIEYCYDDQAGHEECATYNIALIAFWEIGKGLNWVSPAVTAIATGFIAWFTWTLWQSSEKMWKITARSLVIARRAAQAAKSAADTARQSVEAFIDTEQPRVFISKIEPSIKDCPEISIKGPRFPSPLC